MEGEAILAAARKYNRTVQVGTQQEKYAAFGGSQRKNCDAGLLGKIHHAEMCCYYHMHSNATRPLQPVPRFFRLRYVDGPAPLRPYDGLPHRGWWRAFMEYGNGIMGDMCIHMFDAVRWMLNLAGQKVVSSNGGIYVDKRQKQYSIRKMPVFAYDDIECDWQHRTWGTRPILIIPGLLKFMAIKEHFPAMCGSMILRLLAMAKSCMAMFYGRKKNILKTFNRAEYRIACCLCNTPAHAQLFGSDR